MVFQSFSFLFIFLPVTLVGYYCLRTTRYANWFLLLSSLYFYSAEAVWFIFPLLTSSLFDYFAGLFMKKRNEDAKFRKKLLISSICVNLGFLAIFKYTTWLSGHLSALFGLMGIAMTPLIIPLPPGISFYTFQSMSYTIDIYKREFQPTKNLIDFISYVSFFPQLIAGPIMRAKDLLPQLSQIRPVPSFNVFSHALYLIIFGLFMKLVIADNLGGIVENVESLISPDRELTAGLGLVFAYGFTFQIYCDFYAYSTIARGAAKMFGINLMWNFNSPYISSNPSDFWRRWHISLSTWLRDYLYVALGGNQGGRLLTLRNLLITMAIGGLWHGAGVLFIIWGIFHGLLLVVYRVAPIDEWCQRILGKRLGTFVGIFIFFHLVVIGWIFFRADPNNLSAIFGSIFLIPSAISAHISNYMNYFDNLPTFNTASQMASAQTSLSDYIHIYSEQLSKVIGLWIGTILGTVKGYFGTHWYFTVYMYGVLAYAWPMWASDWLASSKKVEFGDLFLFMPFTIRLLLILTFFYAIVILGRRDAIDFIYFAF
ncbi:MBOAT family O-acyltransferase [Terasakiella pusilla]|uniref:MBOAT family O-acyltransferase n=1 Tax=Terasakiella pusilla TaxID=64973 RepID=UPI003AA81348